jgi:hypothetical protein
LWDRSWEENRDGDGSGGGDGRGGGEIREAQPEVEFGMRVWTLDDLCFYFFFILGTSVFLKLL